MLATLVKPDSNMSALQSPFAEIQPPSTSALRLRLAPIKKKGIFRNCPAACDFLGGWGKKDLVLKHGFYSVDHHVFSFE
jgi:hypothetical protein